jgi:fucose permease
VQPRHSNPPVVPRQYLLAFILLTACFAAWGPANNMTDPLVKVFSRIRSMSNLQGALVQFSFYGAYFCFALPAAILIKRFSYKTGVLTGLGVFIFGALLFYPASLTMNYLHFLLAIYILASGLSILETSCNPYIIALGADPSKRIDFLPTLRRLFRNSHYAFGVGAQFFYVAAQVCVWTFLIQYATLVLEFTEEQAGWYLQASILIFLVFRFICTALMRVIRPSAMLLVMAALAGALSLYAVVVPGLSGLWAIVCISACMSLMFPTIYGIALQGLGPDTKIGAAGLVMAILGGALFPLGQARIIDTVSANASYLVPFVCFVVVAAYAVFDLRKLRIAHAS